MLATILGVLLGVIFIGAGGMKAAQGREKLISNPKMGWVEDFSDQQVRGIGALEVLGGLGVIAGGLLAPIVPALAAIGLVLTMLGAAYTHFKRGENQAIIANVVLLALAAAVAAMNL